MREQSDDHEQVGSLAEETWRLLAAFGITSRDTEGRSCPHGWCPLCRLADLVHEHPELLDDVTNASAKLHAAVVDFAKVVSEATKRD